MPRRSHGDQADDAASQDMKVTRALGLLSRDHSAENQSTCAGRNGSTDCTFGD